MIKQAWQKQNKILFQAEEKHWEGRRNNSFRNIPSPDKDVLPSAQEVTRRVPVNSPQWRGLGRGFDPYGMVQAPIALHLQRRSQGAEAPGREGRWGRSPPHRPRPRGQGPARADNAAGTDRPSELQQRREVIQELVIDMAQVPEHLRSNAL